MIKKAKNRTLAFVGVLACFLTLGLIAPQTASAAVTERWTGSVNCRFPNVLSYIRVKALVQSKTVKKDGHNYSYKRPAVVGW